MPTRGWNRGLDPDARLLHRRSMSKVTIWHNPRCTKSRQTLKLLEERGVEPDVILYLQDPPSADELERVLGALGMEPQELMRKKEAREAGLHKADLDRRALVEAMVEHPIVIERPVVLKGKRAALGRPPEDVLRIL
jgi:arsenate reductase